MMKVTLIGACICILASTTPAGEVNHAVSGTLHWSVPGKSAVFVAHTDMPVAPQSAVMAYDNWTPTTLGGLTRLPTRLRVGTDEIGDDTPLLPGTGGHLDSIGFTTANLSSTGALVSNRMRLRWYDASNMNVSGEFVFNVTYSVPIAPGRAVLSGFEPGALAFLNITIPDNILMSVQMSDPVGIDAADFGQLTGGPNTVGSSSSLIRNFTTGQNIDLGQGNNLGLFIRTVPIPAPASATLGMILGVGFGLRRRRSCPAHADAGWHTRFARAVGPR